MITSLSNEDKHHIYVNVLLQSWLFYWGN